MLTIEKQPVRFISMAFYANLQSFYNTDISAVSVTFCNSDIYIKFQTEREGEGSKAIPKHIPFGDDNCSKWGGEPLAKWVWASVLLVSWGFPASLNSACQIINWEQKTSHQVLLFPVLVEEYEEVISSKKSWMEMDVWGMFNQIDNKHEDM